MKLLSVRNKSLFTKKETIINWAKKNVKTLKQKAKKMIILKFS